MRKLDLTDYQIPVDGPEGTRLVPYKIRESVANLLFNPELRLGGVELLKQDTLARKVLGVREDFVLLEAEEFSRIRAAVDTFKGFSRGDVEFVRRVLECPEVEVRPAD